MTLILTRLVPTAVPPILHLLKAEATPNSAQFGTWDGVDGLETAFGLTSVVFPLHQRRLFPYSGKYIESSRKRIS